MVVLSSPRIGFQRQSNHSFEIDNREHRYKTIIVDVIALIGPFCSLLSCLVAGVMEQNRSLSKWGRCSQLPTAAECRFTSKKEYKMPKLGQFRMVFAAGKKMAESKRDLSVV